MAVASEKFICLLVGLLLPCYSAGLSPPLLEKQGIHIRCFRCIRDLFDTTGRCPIFYSNETGCGPFLIIEPVWENAGRILPDGKSGFKSCVRSDLCSMRTIQSFIDKHAKDCNNDGIIDCQDIIRLHLSRNGYCHIPLGEIAAAKFNGCLNEFFSEKPEQRKSIQSDNHHDNRDIAVKGSGKPVLKKAQNNSRPLTFGHQGVHIECLTCIAKAFNYDFDECNKLLFPRDCSNILNINVENWANSGYKTTSAATSRDSEGYNACIKDLFCSLETFQSLADKYYDKDCNGDNKIDCHDYLRIFSLGYNECGKKLKSDVKKRFTSCLALSPNALIGLSTIG